MTDDELIAIKQRRAGVPERLEADGPFLENEFFGHYWQITKPDMPAYKYRAAVVFVEYASDSPEARFFAAAPTDIDALIAEVERLRKTKKPARHREAAPARDSGRAGG